MERPDLTDWIVVNALGGLDEENLDYEIDRQAADGSWRPNWSWAEQDAEAWATAAREWAGVIAASTLSSLKAYGHLA